MTEGDYEAKLPDGSISTDRPPLRSFMYSQDTLTLAESRGYYDAAHRAALASGDEDRIGLTHPCNCPTQQRSRHCPPTRRTGRTNTTAILTCTT